MNLAPEYDTREVDLKHSALGKAAFVISIALLVFMTIFGMVLVTYDGEEFPAILAVSLRLGFMLFFFLFLLSTGLGIAGLFQKDRKKPFAVLAVVMDVLVVLIYYGLFLIYD